DKNPNQGGSSTSGNGTDLTAAFCRSFETGSNNGNDRQSKKDQGPDVMHDAQVSLLGHLGDHYAERSDRWFVQRRIRRIGLEFLPILQRHQKNTALFGR